MKEDLDSTFADCTHLLKSYLFRFIVSVQDVEDIIQDTYIRASAGIEQFKGESSLKTWLFAIATNLAKDNQRAKKRWPENVTDICKSHALADPVFFAEAMQINAVSPQGQFEIKEHITFCLHCISKSLPLEQQICLFLKEIFAFKINEISVILDTSDAMVKYYLHTARAKMIDIFSGRCALINKEGVCHQCTELNGIFNPKQIAQEVAMKIEMAAMAGRADKAHLFDLRMKVVREIDPFLSGGADLQLHHYEHNRKIMENYPEKSDG